MKQIKILLGFCLVFPLQAWGFKAHKIISTQSLKTLPPETKAWFIGQEAYFEERSIYPDQKRSTDRSEAPHHFLNLEIYQAERLAPLTIEEASVRVGADKFQRTGTVPWRVNEFYELLVEAFRKKDIEEVVRLSSELGHYVADAHVPLHSTINYDGQLTNQKGLHSAWESQLVQKFVDQNMIEIKEAKPYSKPTSISFSWINESFALVPKVLASDQSAMSQTQTGIQRNTQEYWEAFWTLEGTTVIQRMHASSQSIGNMILSAWIDAGKPQPPR